MVSSDRQYSAATSIDCRFLAGWALTLLSKENLSYASTAQTIGLNTGYFLSFTVFLAFNSVEFRFVHPFLSLDSKQTERLNRFRVLVEQQ